VRGVGVLDWQHGLGSRSSVVCISLIVQLVWLVKVVGVIV
jgi:hypothetical protein